MECRAYGICLDSQSRGYLGKDRKVSSAAGGNLSRMHKTQETAKESRLNFVYSHLRNRTLASCPRVARFAPFRPTSLQSLLATLIKADARSQGSHGQFPIQRRKGSCSPLRFARSGEGRDRGNCRRKRKRQIGDRDGSYAPASRAAGDL